MQNQNSIFQKPIIKVLSLIFAFTALTVSIIFSQNNSESKKDKKIENPAIYNSSKSMSPNIKNKQKEKSPAQIKEQTNSSPKEEPKLEEKISESKKDKPESKTKEKKKYLIMPSSKAPDPGQ